MISVIGVIRWIWRGGVSAKYVEYTIHPPSLFFARSVLIFTGILILAAYLNIGWTLGTYSHDHVLGKPAETTFQKILQGGFGLFGGDDNNSNSTMRLIRQIGYSILWPMIVFVTVISWVAYGLWLFLYFLGYGIYCLLWFVFAGGMAKFFGVG